MKLQELAHKDNRIIILCGGLASGKGHYAKTYFPDAKVIGVSSVVKELTNLKKRSELSTTAHLDDEITSALIEKVEAASSDSNVVIDGIRQPSILKALVKHFGKKIQDIIWLDVPEDRRRAHFVQRDAKKDDMPFDRADQSDKQLGIDDVESYIRKNGRVIPY